MFRFLRRERSLDTQNGEPGAATTPAIRGGFINYGATDFAEQLGLPDTLAQQVAADYLELLDNNRESAFSKAIKAKPRDGFEIGQLLSKRYGLAADRLSEVVRFYMSIASALRNQDRMRELGIDDAEWISAKVPPPPCHSALNGRHFDPRVGIDVDGARVLPGVGLRCNCRGKATVFREQ